MFRKSDLGTWATQKRAAESQGDLCSQCESQGLARGHTAHSAQQERLLDEDSKVVNERRSFQNTHEASWAAEGNTEGWKTGRRKHGLLSAHICNLRHV